MTDTDAYGAVMLEIKKRGEVIDHFLSERSGTFYEAPRLESIGLQYRKIFELIAFASLAANRAEYAKAYADFAKHWEVAKLLKNLKKVNPDFYPKPVIETPATSGSVAAVWRNRSADYLNEAELAEAHGRCGALLHAANPFGRTIDYDYFRLNFRTWPMKILNLLQSHQIRLVGDTGFYLVHMEELSSKHVTFYRFDLVERPPTLSA